jgi:adenine-specific DNA-methyltransferase
VKICRLRLWIELLKRAYYSLTPQNPLSNSLPGGERTGEGGGHLEVLPNIDINIKQGNSLVSRFDLDGDLSSVFKNSDYSLKDYKEAVRNYKQTGDRTEKADLQKLIDNIKDEYTSTLTNLRPINQKLSKARGRLEIMQSDDLFGEVKFSKQDIEKQKKKLKKLEEQKAEEENGAFYNQAFEWRFEFPEVLDDEGRFTGFDVVIGNPPYVRQEQFKELKPYLKERYTVYQGTADLYSYFIELGIDLLSEGGHFQYIIANKWMRANYGKPLREWLQKEVNINAIYDFGDLPVFEEATTYPCLLQLSKTQPTGLFSAAEIETLDFDHLENYLKEHRFDSDQTKLQPDGWALIDEQAQRLLEKLKKKGAPLGEYVDGKIYRGVLTGLNEAFVIDEETKEQLIEEDPKSEELIKPFLAGKDIKRYQVPKTVNYLILIPNGFTNKIRGNRNAWDWLSNNYPPIAKHLKQFEKKAKKRYDQGQYWWELRACDYYDEFEKTKILYQEIATYQAFTWDNSGAICNNKIFMIPESKKYILAILNSKITWFVLYNLASKLRGNALAMQYPYVSQIPIIKPDKKQKEKFEEIFTQILNLKEQNPQVDTTELEAKIDRLVYELYGLSEEEIGVVERKPK